MSQARRTLSIPPQIGNKMRQDSNHEVLWYVGALQAENGRDVDHEPTPVPGGLETPLPVRPSGKSPDLALKATRSPSRESGA